MSKSLLASLKSAYIIEKNGYPYLIHPLFDGFPQLNPSLLDEVVKEMEVMIRPFLPIDRLVTIEAMGIPLTTMLSQRLGVPFTIIRKRSYGLPDEITIEQQTGYATSNLFINGINRNDTIVIVDDIISTGGTLQGVLKGLQLLNVKIKAACFILDKGTAAKYISKEFDIPFSSLIKVQVKNGNITVRQ